MTKDDLWDFMGFIEREMGDKNIADIKGIRVVRSFNEIEVEPDFATFMEFSEYKKYKRKHPDEFFLDTIEYHISAKRDTIKDVYLKMECGIPNSEVDNVYNEIFDRNVIYFNLEDTDININIFE